MFAIPLFFLLENNIIGLFISLEIFLLGITVDFMTSALDGYDIDSVIFAFMIIFVAGAESAIGLSLVVSYYRLRGKLDNTI